MLGGQIEILTVVASVCVYVCVECVCVCVYVSIYMYTFMVHVNYTHIHPYHAHLSYKCEESGLRAVPPQYQHGYIVATLDVVPALAAVAAVTF